MKFASMEHGVRNRPSYSDFDGLKKSKSRTVLLLLFFLFSFSVLKFLPGMLVVQDIFTGLVFLFSASTYLYLLLINRLRLSSLEKYGLLVLAIAPIMVAYASNAEFGQPFWYGYLNQRGFALIGSALIFIRLFRAKRFSLLDVERSLLWLAWLSLFANTAANILVDPNRLGNISGFSDAGSGSGDGKLMLDTTFITFGFFYYAFSNFRMKSRTKLCATLLFLSYLIFISSGRFALISVAAAFFVQIYKWSSYSKLIIMSSKMVASAVVLGVMIYAVPSNKIASLQEKFEDAIHVVMTGTETSDASANARIFEIAIAEPYVKKNWLLGNGFISNQWKGGFADVLGYFHPSDIGLYGIIYVFGVVGFLLLIFQFYFTWRYTSYLSVKRGQHSRLTDAVTGYLVFFALNSMTTGRFAFSFEQGLLLTAVLYCAVQENKQRHMALKGWA